MNLIFGDIENTTLLQELLSSNNKFFMILSSDSTRIQNTLDNFKQSTLFSFNEDASVYLNSKSLTFKELSLDEFRKTKTLLEK